MSASEAGPSSAAFAAPGKSRSNYHARLLGVLLARYEPCSLSHPGDGEAWEHKPIEDLLQDNELYAFVQTGGLPVFIAHINSLASYPPGGYCGSDCDGCTDESCDCHCDLDCDACEARFVAFERHSEVVSFAEVLSRTWLIKHGNITGLATALLCKIDSEALGGLSGLGGILFVLERAMAVEPSKTRDAILAKQGMEKRWCPGLGTKRGARGTWKSDLELQQKRQPRGNDVDRTAVCFAREIVDGGHLPKIIGRVKPRKSLYCNNGVKLANMYRATQALLYLLDLEHARVVPVALAEGVVRKLEICMLAIEECRKYEYLTHNTTPSPYTWYNPPSLQWYAAENAYLDRIANSVRRAISLFQPHSEGAALSPPLKRGAGRPRLRTSERKRRKKVTKNKTYARSTKKKGKGPRKL